MSTRERLSIGQLLIKNGYINPTDLEMALELQKNKNIPLAEILVQMGVITAKEVAEALSQQLNIPRWRPDEEEPSPEALGMVSYDLAVRHKILPLTIKDGQLRLAITDPFDLSIIDELTLLTKLPVTPVLATDDEIEDALEKSYSSAGAQSVLTVLQEMQDQPETGYDESRVDLASLEEIANEAPVVRLVNLIIMEGVKAGASDIHLEPFEDEVRVRYRVDGILYITNAPPKKLYPAVVSRIKLMAGMDIAERRLPQDGRISLNTGEINLDLRVAVSPTKHGEQVVLRILNRQNVLLELEQLGFPESILRDFNHLLQHPHGGILVTGPTGSGKTTTLYAALGKLNSPTRKIITIEDPIEYEIKGINQMQVNTKINFTFASGLRAIVRHDPDVILVGEIRDLETAEVAIQSALTGHLVFSTLHTNDAAGALTRLLDMGVEEFLVSSTIRGILAQRLVRTICPECKVPHKPTLEEIKVFGLEPDTVIYRGTGCDFCKEGYRGRTGIYELLMVDEEVENMIMQRKNSSVIKEYAVKKGMVTLRASGRAKVLEGITTPEEVLRVTVG